MRPVVQSVDALRNLAHLPTVGQRSVVLVVFAAAVAFMVNLPALDTEPFFVGVNTAFAALFVGLGHHLLVQHGERVTGVCFMIAAAGWQVTNLDSYPVWGAMVSWLVGGTLVYTSIGWGVLRFGERQLGGAGRVFVGMSLACTAGTSTLLMLVSRPEWLSYPPGSVWLDPWPNPTVSLVVIVIACVGYLALWWQFSRLTLRRLRLARPAQRRVLRPLTLAGVAWAGAAAVVTSFGSLLPWALSLHANSNIVGVLSVGVGAALATAINRSRLMVTMFVESLPSDRSPESLTSYARRALSDPTADLWFVVPDGPILIDGGGRPRELPDPAAQDRFEQWIFGSDGQRVAVLLGDPLLRGDAEVVRSFARVLSIVAENQQLHAISRMRLAQLTAVRAAERLAFDRARERFHRDLHDGVQQTIAAARMDLDGVLDGLEEPDPTTAAEAVGALDRKLLLALDQIRGLKEGSHPPELAFGLKPALDRILAELRIDAERQVCEDDLGVLTVPVYLLLRETLTNVHKHARGAAVEVEVALRSGTIDVVVRDRGSGGASPRAGGGLHGLADRVAELGGRFAVHSPIGVGTTVRAVIPVVQPT